MAPVKRPHSRSPSPELGDDSFGVARNARTGRPIRKSAGRKSAGSGFIDWDAVPVTSDEDEKESVDSQASDPADTAEDDRDLAPSIFKRVKKPRRDPTPTPPVSPTLSSVPASTPELSPGPQEPPTMLPPITLSINVDPAQRGPIQLQLDLNSLCGQLPGSQSHCRLHAPSPQNSSPRSSTYDDTKCGFLSLAAELRNQVYRLIFVAEKPLTFYRPGAFRRSSQMLSTCSQIHHEARPFLYSTNEFIIGRNFHGRSKPFAEDDPEVGYKDFLRFLRQIGPTNVGLLRDLTLVFGDATSSSVRGNSVPEERRFVYDDVLLSCLRNLVRNGKLRCLSLSFQGKKELRQLDRHFLDTMKGLKADEVKFVNDPFVRTDLPSWHGCKYVSKQQDSVMHDLTQDITRKKKIYD